MRNGDDVFNYALRITNYALNFRGAVESEH